MISNQRRLVGIFKSFVTRVFLPLTKANEAANSEWNYFSNMLGQETIDFGMIDVYLDVLNKTGIHSFQLSSPPPQPQEEEVLKNPAYQGSFNTLNSLSPDPMHIDSNFQLNRTVGGNQRAKIAAMFPLKGVTPFVNEFNPTQKKLVPRNSLKGMPASYSILSSMETIYKTLGENQLRLENNSMQGNNTPPQYYKFKNEERTS